MKIIVITSPGALPGEASALCRLLDNGITSIHIRKPDWDERQCRQLLEQIPEQYYHQLVLHQHFKLCQEFHLQGIHLNKRHPFLPVHHEGTVSCSCHSLEEVAVRKQVMDYVFLSPVFDSISKSGYRSAFPLSALKQAQEEGIIDRKVIALGGVTYDKLPLLESLSFGGGAMLGEIWGKPDLC
ncbi:MAG: thiamine phosphate synthase [Prevotella sp.]|jgi:thiamine-phosphate pyrophosphorylase|nr:MULTISPECIES: thiamine phosphate synthase [unclassified Prevotella]MCH3991400.1 thiamine phosphate synthase [Prevotella sp.]MCH4100314.1 thiamine phosphate synthase [Prevotella sp.]MCH4216889.1 thiamine phosphate synthase [Prevotella sp.]MCI1372275.1 thiamine phosphate synthase [Prevotella sp.]MCI1415647.1 thiamine phosphate synthase [Prevotella sp.]